MNFFFQLLVLLTVHSSKKLLMKVIKKKNVRISHFKRFPSQHYMLGKLADKRFYSAWHKAKFCPYGVNFITLFYARSYASGLNG